MSRTFTRSCDNESSNYNKRNIKCSKCDREATRRLTPDLDIGGIPVCDSWDCETLIRLELMRKTIELQDGIKRNT
jgi:hypothetical protein